MKVLIILFFITFVYSQEGQCTNITYSLEGERCDGLTRKCKIFTVCNQTESVCRKGSIGDFCISSSDCFLSGGSQEGVRCVENKCIKPRYNGYSCSKNEHCFGNVCQSGVCRGKNNGDACSPTALVECDQNHFCSFKTKTCIKQLNFNETCHEHLVDQNIDPRRVPEGSNFNVMCSGGLMCMGDANNKRCEKYRGGNIGDTCNYARDGHYGCKFGLQCDKTLNRCYEHGGSNYKCNGDSRDCRTNEECVCQNNSTTVGKCTAVSGSNEECLFAPTANRWLECSIKNNCPLDSKNYFNRWLVDVFTPETCMGKYCGNIPKPFLCCSLTKQDFNQFSEYQIGKIQDYCIETSNVWIVFVIGLIIATFLSLVLLFIGFFFVSRQNSNSGYNDL